MNLTRTHIITIIIAISVLLAAAGINSSDFGGPAFLTSNRISYILFFCIILSVMNTSLPFHELKVYILLYLIFVSLYILSGVISTLLNGFNELFFSRIISWLISFVISVGLCVVIVKENYTDWKRLGYYFFIGYMLLLLYAFLFLLEELTSSSFRILFVREKLSLLSEGQTRFVTGLVWGYFLSYIYIFYGTNSPKKLSLFFVNITLFFILLLCGSRQSMLAMLGFNLLLFFRLTKKNIMTLVGLVIITMASLTYLYNSGNIFVLGLYDRVVESSAKQYDSGYDRTEVYNDAISIFNSHPIFGIGPENFPSHSLNSTGLTAHNDFLKLLSEHGIIFSILIISIIFFILLINLKRNYSSNFFPYKVFASALITTIVVFSNFNTIFHELMVSILTAFAFSTYRIDRSIYEKH